MKPDPRDALVTVFGLGRLRPAPGTWGSLPPPLLVLALLWSGAALWVVNLTLVLLGAAFGIACARFGHLAEQRYGAKDPRQVVADETAGQCVALLLRCLVKGGQVGPHDSVLIEVLERVGRWLAH